MERAVALKKLRKLLGNGLGFRVDPKAPDAEVRAQARTDAVRLGEEYRIASDARKARLDALLAADPEYQRLEAEATRLRKAREQASGMSHHFRFTVGTSSGLFFHVKAQGDSWEDVITQLEARR